MSFSVAPELGLRRGKHSVLQRALYPEGRSLDKTKSHPKPQTGQRVIKGYKPWQMHREAANHHLTMYL